MDEFKTRDLLKAVAETIVHLRDAGEDPVHVTTVTKSLIQFNPLIVVKYNKKKYVMFTSRHYTDSKGNKTFVWSSIRMVQFDSKGSPITEKVTLEEFKENHDRNLTR